MTKATGVGRGGKRSGSGRKPAPPTPRMIAKAADPVHQAREEASRQRTIEAFTAANMPKAIRATPAEIEALAQTYTTMAVEVLAEVALVGDKDASRVLAARNLLILGGMMTPKPPGKSKAVEEPAKPDAPAADSWDRLLAN